MKVFLEPTCVPCSRAMHRVAAALRRHAPPNVEVVRRRAAADLQVLHAIGPLLPAPDKPYAIIQYCLTTAEGWDEREWRHAWTEARLVWSYYDLADRMPSGARFYFAPLGVDAVFAAGPRRTGNGRDVGVVTSGYVSGAGAEAIEEVAEAARRLGLRVFHLGPKRPEGMAERMEKTWVSGEDIEDEELALWYSRARWVSGLRHGEGYELPVIEGLACGARPIVFDRPDMRRWYDGLATLVPECSGGALVEALVEVLAQGPLLVAEWEREEVVRTFDWRVIAEGFWSRLLEAA